MRFLPGLDHLRKGKNYRVLKSALADGRERFGFRLNHYSVQSNHLHLLSEADDERALSRGIQGLAVRIAKRFNRVHGRRGKVFADRYHAHVLRSPREVRHALAYVLNNARKHEARRRPAWLDPCSSALWFDGWRPDPFLEAVLIHVGERGPPPVAPPRSWLLKTGWKRHGLVACSEVPGPRDEWMLRGATRRRAGADRGSP